MVFDCNLLRQIGFSHEVTKARSGLPEVENHFVSSCLRGQILFLWQIGQTPVFPLSSPAQCSTPVLLIPVPRPGLEGAGIYGGS